MKLYVFPTEVKCNASCGFCITKHRRMHKEEFLDLSKLEKVLKNINVEKIEITGGGEPFLHPRIEDLTKICTNYFKTQLYTNGSLVKGNENFKELDYLCISKAHYNEDENKRIMGINQNMEVIKNLGVKIKLSLLLHNSGVNNEKEIWKYLKSALDFGVKKVVIRELSPNTPKEIIEKEFVSVKYIFDKMRLKEYLPVREGAEFNFRNVNVCFKYSPISCECENLFLHSDGYLGGLDDINRT
jgi:MoaA/NifB/PqqE/SkfB family radical SAM enzyme